MTYNECELNYLEKEIIRRIKELDNLRIKRAVLKKENQESSILQESGLIFFRSNKLVELAKVNEEIKRLEFYINNLYSKKEVIIEKIESEKYLKDNKALWLEIKCIL